VPIYDYTCSACRRITEVIHGINDHGPKFCPECGAKGSMTKAFVAPTVHFKGSGWAKKDRSTSARSSRPKDEGGSDTTRADGGGDTKPAASGDADKGGSTAKPAGDSGAASPAAASTQD
jgi:putative FmdB family regulatory protein